MRIIFVRQQDYWIFPLSFLGVVFVTVAFYAGVMTMRLPAAIVGFAILYFMTHVIKKNYTKRLAVRYLVICLIAAALTALGLHYLTN